MWSQTTLAISRDTHDGDQVARNPAKLSTGVFLLMALKPEKMMGPGGQGAGPQRGCAQRAQRKPTEGLLRRKSPQGCEVTPCESLGSQAASDLSVEAFFFMDFFPKA